MKFKLKLMKFLDKINVAFATQFFRIRYFPFVLMGNNTTVRKSVVVKNFWNLTATTHRSIQIRFEGNNSIGSGTIFQGTGDIVLGDRSFCGEGCVFGCNNSIKIGKNVMMAQYVTLRDTDHVFESIETPMIDQGIKTLPIEIEDDVWLGHGVVVLKGVKISRGAVVAAGAVVTSDVPAYSIYGGVPARKIGERN